VLVNATLAKRAWPGVSPIGRCLTLGVDSTSCRTIVGTVADFRTMRLREEPVNIVAVPLAQAVGEKMWSLNGVDGLTVRVASDPAAMATSLRSLVRDAAGDVRSVIVRPLEESLDYEMRPWRLGSAMFGLFAALTLVLAAIGLFGTVAFTVTQRTAELGIRSALGARWSHLAAVVVGGTAIAMGVGVGSGVAVSAVASRLVVDLLFETPRHDAVAYGAALVVLLVTACVAAAIPVRRATRVDPAIALRAE
jgi:putative ABC transport system permease protein